MSKIVELRAENVKRLKAVNIKPDGSLVIIGGRNAQGKSSVLDSIATTLGGADKISPVPVRQGAEKSTTEIDLGDMIVRRTVQPNGNTSLVITDKEKRRYPSPQAMLDALTGRLSFDPLSFATQEPRKQLETLKTLVGVDFTADDQEREKVYNERTVVNREVERAQISLSQAQHYPDVKEPVDVTALEAELQDASKHNAQLVELQLQAGKKANELNAAKDQEKRAFNNHQELVAAMERLKQRIEEARQEVAAQSKAVRESVTAESEARAAANSFETRDTSAIQQRISAATTHNRKHATNQARATQEKTLAEKKAEAERLTKTIGEIDARKQAKLSAAKFPVDGLGFGAGEVTFNGLPFSQASDAERLRVSVAMAAAMNPKLRVILVKNASLLDDENLSLLAALANEYDLQVWIERVGTKDPSAIIIEDGMVKGQELPDKSPATPLPNETHPYLPDPDGHCKVCAYGKDDSIHALSETKQTPDAPQPAKRETKKPKTETQEPFKDLIP